MEKPWYIKQYEDKDFLHSKTLIFKSFDYGDTEHRHCEICWTRFSNYVGDEHSGYYEPLSKSWICQSCFNDFNALFDWKNETQ